MPCTSCENFIKIWRPVFSLGTCLYLNQCPVRVGRESSISESLYLTDTPSHSAWSESRFGGVSIRYKDSDIELSVPTRTSHWVKYKQVPSKKTGRQILMKFSHDVRDIDVTNMWQNYKNLTKGFLGGRVGRKKVWPPLAPPNFTGVPPKFFCLGVLRSPNGLTNLTPLTPRVGEGQIFKFWTS